MKASLEKMLYLAEGVTDVMGRIGNCFEGLMLKINTEEDLDTVIASINGGNNTVQASSIPKETVNMAFLDKAVNKAKIYVNESILAGDDFV